MVSRDALKQEVESTPSMLVVESGPGNMTPAQAMAAGLPAPKNPVAEAEDQLRVLLLKDTEAHPDVIAQRKLIASLKGEEAKSTSASKAAAATAAAPTTPPVTPWLDFTLLRKRPRKIAHIW